ncbi:hypothetical protein [Arsenicicoccus dermatophilus]|uniref:hypothetical protein n=1 Tax=Arsenicicoccus dermatophilus TaxID=1076331 RepID=UPI00391734E3
MIRDDSTPTATPKPRTTSVPRAALAIAAAALTAVSLTACNKMSPQTTDRSYAPADGIDMSVGQVQVRNLAVVASAKDATGYLNGLVVNEGQQAAAVSFSFPQASTPVSITVDPGSSVTLTERKVALPKVPVAPGAMTNVVVSSRGGGDAQPLVPVLAPIGPYASMTGTATASGTATATDSGTPTPSGAAPTTAVVPDTTSPTASATTTP